jgi:hypothetical protein
MRHSQRTHKLTGDGVTWRNSGGDSIAKIQWPRQPRVPYVQPRPDALVQNYTGAAIPAFSVLGVLIDGYAFQPSVAAQLQNFQFKQVLYGETPNSSHLGSFAINLTPLGPNAIGPCITRGQTVVQVDVQNGYDRWADIKVGDNTQLISNSLAGSAWINPILRPMSAGKQWCIVQLGNFPYMRHLKVNLLQVGGGGSGGSMFTYNVKDDYGNDVTKSFSGTQPFTPAFTPFGASYFVRYPATTGTGYISLIDDGEFILQYADEPVTITPAP